MNEPNPYAAPQSPASVRDEVVTGDAIVPATRRLRFANLIIDYLAQMAIGFVVGVLVVLLGGEEGVLFLEKTPGIFIGIPILLGYYLLLEAMTSRTLGKLITGTLVVSEDGGTPTFGQFVGRTFARLIPFEAFSFLGTPARGWHDSLPKTFVVKVR